MFISITFMKQTIVQSIGDSYPTGEETKALGFYNVARSHGREIRIVLHSVQQLVSYTTVNTKKSVKLLVVTSRQSQ